jgi:hypothetical protein
MGSKDPAPFSIRESLSVVMPGFMPGIHVFIRVKK